MKRFFQKDERVYLKPLVYTERWSVLTYSTWAILTIIVMLVFLQCYVQCNARDLTFLGNASAIDIQMEKL